MKTEKVILSLAFIFTLLLCKIDTKSQGLKSIEYRIERKVIYNNDTVPQSSENYYYDSEWRLLKIQKSQLVYKLFKYNFENQLANIFTYDYASDSLGWIIQDSTYYYYVNGKLVEEITTFFPSMITHSIKYIYENSYLFKKYLYEDQNLRYFIKYDYLDGFCTKETMYYPINTDTIIYSFTIHHYDKDLLIQSDVFTLDASLDSNEIQVVNYTYDNIGYLIYEKSIQLDSTVAENLNYFYGFEYFTVNDINLSNLELIKLYPNLVKDLINLEISSMSTDICKLYNSNGQLIKAINVRQGLNTLDISNLQS
jgi:hypothetical protein